jgi:nucleoside-diphosphate-sugar epimerase
MQLNMTNSKLKTLSIDGASFIGSAVIQHLINDTEFESYGVDNRKIKIVKEIIINHILDLVDL